MKEIVLDTETTGLSVKDGHRLVEIGCIELDNLIPTKNKFHCYLNFIDGKRLIIHNAEFDLSHINNELKISGNEILKNDIVDTLILARDKFPGSSVSLDALCKRFKVDNSKRVQHTALIDCDLLTKVYINLIDQKEPRLDFKSQDVEDTKFSSKNVAYYKKVVEITPSEKEKHNNYLKNNLKKNYF